MRHLLLDQKNRLVHNADVAHHYSLVGNIRIAPRGITLLPAQISHTLRAIFDKSRTKKAADSRFVIGS